MTKCGCYHCLKMFDKSEIKEYLSNSLPACPFCNFETIQMFHHSCTEQEIQINLKAKFIKYFGEIYEKGLSDEQ